METQTPISHATKVLGGCNEAGQQLGVTREAVRRWVSGINRVTAERAVQIEQATHGQVTRYDLRPDVFDPPPEKHTPA